MMTTTAATKQPARKANKTSKQNRKDFISPFFYFKAKKIQAFAWIILYISGLVILYISLIIFQVKKRGGSAFLTIVENHLY